MNLFEQINSNVVMKYCTILYIFYIRFVSPVSSASSQIEAIFLSQDQTYLMKRDLGKLIGQLTRVYFNRKEYVPLVVAAGDGGDCSVSTDADLQGTLNQIVLNVDKFSAIVIIHDIQMKSRKVAQNFIILTDGAKAFLKNAHLFPPHKFSYAGRIIIVVKHRSHTSRLSLKIVQDILDECLRLNMVNIVVIANQNGRPTMFTFYPYSSGSCGESNLVEVDRWENETLTTNVDLFPVKAAQMNGCPVRVTAIDRYPYVIIRDAARGGQEIFGIEGNLLRFLGLLMNFTITLVEAEEKQWGTWTGLQWTGLTGMLAYGLADVGVGVHTPSLDRLNVTDYSYGYDTVDIVWAIPRFESGSPASKMYEPFKKYIWMLTIAVVIAIALLLYVLQVSLKYASLQVKQLFMSVWLITLGYPVEHMPTGRFACYVFTIWIWASMILRNTYQGSLVGFLTSRTFEPKVFTMRDMLEAGFSFYGTSPIFGLLNDVKDDAVVQGILRKVIICKTQEEYYTTIAEKIATTQEYAAALHFRAKVSQLNYLMRQKGKMDILPETYRSQIVTLAFSRYSPLTEGVNQWIHRISEAGFVDKWEESYQSPDTVAPDVPRILKMVHLTGPFSLLMLGELVASLVFAVEYFETKLKYFKEYIIKLYKKKNSLVSVVDT